MEKRPNTIWVGVVMGSISDEEAMAPARKILEEFDIPFAGTVASAHRSKERLVNVLKAWLTCGCQVFIAGAGAAAHLAGAIAAETTKPVIAVPISSSPLNGLDALLSSVQMPPGIPVATMAINGAANAALFAIQILTIGSPAILGGKLEAYRTDLAQKVEKAAKELEEKGWPEV